MQAIFAIIGLTWKAAFRYRLFWIVSALLLGAVVGLPLLVKDDGTVDGFAQILITYTLTAVSSLLGLCTLWLACGTLARDLEECQIQMVAVKPVARWKIWIGKWLGIVLLNAALLAVAGGGIYGLLEWRASKLSPGQQLRLRNEVLVSRASAKERNFDKEIAALTDRIYADREKKHKLDGVEPQAAWLLIRQEVISERQVVGPSRGRKWVIHLGKSKDELRGLIPFLRVKFNVPELTHPETYLAQWQIGVPKQTALWQSEVMSLSPDSFHEFPVLGQGIDAASLSDDKGNLTIWFGNPNESAMLFPLADGLEVLYREGSFGLNFVRGLGVILCWMALLAAIGLCAASLLSFPVAAFVSLALLAMVFFSGTLSNVVSDGTIMGWDSGKSAKGHTAADNIIIPVFSAALRVINLAQEFSPIDYLSTGRSITWLELGQAFVQVVLLLSGIFCVIGIVILNRRELGTAQGTQ